MGRAFKRSTGAPRGQRTVPLSATARYGRSIADPPVSRWWGSNNAPYFYKSLGRLEKIYIIGKVLQRPPNHVGQHRYTLRGRVASRAARRPATEPRARAGPSAG
eukprot:COSAG02_NODE_38958_length_422_cov_2.068111_1_plen_103_part_01